jgi:hypothetical protein
MTSRFQAIVCHVPALPIDVSRIISGYLECCFHPLPKNSCSNCGLQICLGHRRVCCAQTYCMHCSPRCQKRLSSTSNTVEPVGKLDHVIRILAGSSVTVRLVMYDDIEYNYFFLFEFKEDLKFLESKDWAPNTLETANGMIQHTPFHPYGISSGSGSGLLDYFLCKRKMGVRVDKSDLGKVVLSLEHIQLHGVQFLDYYNCHPRVIPQIKDIIFNFARLGWTLYHQEFQ